jgi:WD40 repeat protein
LATGGSDNLIHIWDLETRQPISRLIGHTGTVATLACDGSGTVLVSGGYDTTLRIWHVGGKGAAATASREPASEAR